MGQDGNMAFRLARLGFRRWKWRYFAVVVLVALTFGLHTLYSVWLESTLIGEEHEPGSLKLGYDVMVVLEPGAKIRAPHEVPQVLGGKKAGEEVIAVSEAAAGVTVQSVYGSFELLGLQPGSQFFRNSRSEQWQGKRPENSGEVVLDAAFAQQAGLALGDRIPVSVEWQMFPWQTGRFSAVFEIVGTYEGYSIAPALAKLEDVIALTAASAPNRHLLNYNRNHSSLAELLRAMQQVYPEAPMIYPTLPQTLSQGVLSQILQSGRSLVYLLALFITISVLTLAVVTFLERRKELAALKTIGTSNGQITAMMIWEYGLSELFGVMGGLVIVLAAASYLRWIRSLSLVLLARVMLSALFTTLVAMSVGVAYPIYTARIATVTQLLHSRRIPLLTLRFNYMRRPVSDLVYRERVENVRIIKLLPPEEAREIILLKQEGDPTKKGEVIATQDAWFGFLVYEWEAPCNGRVTILEAGGVIGIRPDCDDEPFYPYPQRMLEEEERRELMRLKGAEEARILLSGERLP